ncbi:MAG TPA: amidohydrolase [Thermoanaerobacterales bacterium]|nr:amidohydrolase [Thermoanaerobacterales bacterium]
MKFGMDIYEKMKSKKDRLVEFRRDFHKNPELSYEEVRTAKIVADHLRSLGLEVKTGLAKTGVTGYLEVDPSYPTVGLRADMDAIAITELSDVPYKSQVDGVMHACGHDGHTAALMVAAELLCEHKEDLKCNVKFIFQPAEEVLPGGANKMIQDGCLEGVDVIYGGHLNSPLEVGTTKCFEGLSLASINLFEITITGEGTHTSYPHMGIDTIITASHLVQALQSLVSREMDPVIPKTISVCQIHGGNHFTATPQTVELKGSYCTMDEDQRKMLEEEMHKKVKQVCELFGAKGELKLIQGYPLLVNHKPEAEYVIDIIESILGPESVIPSKPTLGAEDFSYYLQEIPGAFFFTGAMNPEKGINYPHHHPKFDIDEDALVNHATILSLAALNYNQS